MAPVASLLKYYPIPAEQVPVEGAEGIAAETGTNCAICFSPFIDEPVVGHALQASKEKEHLVHKRCIQIWAKINKTCHICRAPIDPSSLFSAVDYIKIAAQEIISDKILSLVGTIALISTIADFIILTISAIAKSSFLELTLVAARASGGLFLNSVVILTGLGIARYILNKKEENVDYINLAMKLTLTITRIALLAFASSSAFLILIARGAAVRAIGICAFEGTKLLAVNATRTAFAAVALGLLEYAKLENISKEKAGIILFFGGIIARGLLVNNIARQIFYGLIIGSGLGALDAIIEQHALTQRDREIREQQRAISRDREIREVREQQRAIDLAIREQQRAQTLTLFPIDQERIALYDQVRREQADLLSQRGYEDLSLNALLSQSDQERSERIALYSRIQRDLVSEGLASEHGPLYDLISQVERKIS